MTIKEEREKGILITFIDIYNKNYNTELSIKEMSDKPDAICYFNKQRTKLIGVEIVELLQNPSIKMGKQRAIERQYISAMKEVLTEVIGNTRVIIDVNINYPFLPGINIEKEKRIFMGFLTDIKNELLQKNIFNKKREIGNYMNIERITIRKNQSLENTFYKNNITEKNNISLWRKEIKIVIDKKKIKAQRYNFRQGKLYLLIRSTWEIDNIKESYNKEEFGIGSLAPFCAVWILHFPVNIIDIEYKISIIQ